MVVQYLTGKILAKEPMFLTVIKYLALRGCNMKIRICFISLLIALCMTPVVYGETIIIGSESNEIDDVGFKISHKLEEIINANSNHKAICLTIGDKSKPLSERLNQINELNGDLLISIGVRRQKDKSKYGYEIYNAKLVMDNSEADSTKHSKDLQFIVNDLKKEISERTERAERLSGQLFKQLSESGYYSQHDGPLNAADDLLIGVSAPASRIIVYLDGQGGKKMFNTPSQLQSFAHALYRGLMNYTNLSRGES